ncbi:MAG: redoxin domain-containing protein [Limisphaerales bacterium]
MNKSKPSSLAFRIRVTILLMAGVFALSQSGRLGRFATTEGILQSHSPDPAILHQLFRNSPDTAQVMQRIWACGKLPHRWEIINYLNRNVGQRPDLLPAVNDIVRQAASDPDLTLRLTALNLLRVIDHPDWRSSIHTALNDSDPVARESAQTILQQAGMKAPTNLPPREIDHVRGPGFGHLAFHDFKQQSYALTQFTNRPVLLHFFTTWSSNCVSEIPALVKLREMAPSELQIVGVNLDGVPGVRHDHSTGDGEHEDCENCQGLSEGEGLFKSVERHVIVKGYNYPVVFDLDGIATAQLEGSELPVHVLLDSEHRLLRRYAGTRSATNHNQIVRQLLGVATMQIQD